MSEIDRPSGLELVKTTPTSLALKGQSFLSIAEWSDVGRSLGKQGAAMLWWIGDWFRMGEKTYGSTYTEAMAITGLAYGTLRNCAYVASNVALSFRNDKLSFKHHYVVAPLAPWAQKRWLDAALAEGMTAEELRSRIATDAQMPATTRPDFRLSLTVAPERAERWNEAAASVDLDFAEWATRILDRAAALGVAVDAALDEKIRELEAA